MKKLILVLLCVIGFLIGWSIGERGEHKNQLQQIYTLQQKLATKQLQVDLTIASHKECRFVLKQVLETFDYIQPRPITIED